MTSPTCTVDLCPRKIYAKGLCSPHYRRVLRNGEVGGPVRDQLPPSPPVCTVDECDRKHYAKGLCATHYHRVLRTGESGGPIPDKPEARFCSRCSKKHYAKGLCKSHYQKALVPQTSVPYWHR